MSLVDQFMLAFNDTSDKTMGVSVMVCNGQTFDVVANLSSKSVSGDLGGIEPCIQNIVTAQPKNVTNPKSLINKRCTIDGTAYRVSTVDVGTIAIHFSLIDPNESR